MQTEGYLIVLQPQLLLEAYGRSCLAKQNPGPLRELRRAFSAFEPTRYRGISRNSLTPFPSLDQKVIDDFQATGCDMKSNARACRRFREILDLRGGYDSVSDEDMLASMDDARQVLLLTDEPSSREIIHVSCPANEPTPSTLGYDVGYWGGDHFSLIADTIVVPRWHPPMPEDFAEVAQELSVLNEHLLFESPAEAAAFRSFYQSKPWAESVLQEPAASQQDQFYIIRVEETPA